MLPSMWLLSPASGSPVTTPQVSQNKIQHTKIDCQLTDTRHGQRHDTEDTARKSTQDSGNFINQFLFSSWSSSSYFPPGQSVLTVPALPAPENKATMTLPNVGSCVPVDTV